MWPTWSTLPAGWTYVLRVTLAAVVLFVSACAALGHSSSNRSSMPSDGGYAGMADSGNGNGGIWDVTSSSAGRL